MNKKLKKKRTESAGTLMLDFQPPELCETNVCCLSHPPVYNIWYSITGAKTFPGVFQLGLWAEPLHD
jgi:hypothetical protein